MMKKLLSCILFVTVSLSYAQVGIGTQDPDPSAMLEVKSTTKGFLPPRHDNTTRATITDAAQGLIIYNTEENCLQINLSSDPQVPEWECLGQGTQSTQAPQAPSNTVSTSLLATFTGKTCFDIGETDQTATGGGSIASRSSSKVDFAVTNTFDYTFTAQSANISNVRFIVINTNGTPLVSVAGNNTGAVANGTTVTATVTFANTLNSDALATTNNTALTGDVYAVYDHNGTTYQVKQTAKVRDWQCCGAFVEPGLFREFMCHNLGADETKDPHVGSRDVQGDYFQWGREVSGADADGNLINGDAWGTRGASFTANNWTSKPGPKAALDPCPAGYRMPLNSELEGVGIWGLVTGNTGAFQNTGSGNQNGIYNVTTNGAVTLSLPLSGTFGAVSGTPSKLQEGTHGWYWTSERLNTNDPNDYKAVFIMGSSNGDFSYLASQVDEVGSSVRCIAE